PLDLRPRGPCRFFICASFRPVVGSSLARFATRTGRASRYPWAPPSTTRLPMRPLRISWLAFVLILASGLFSGRPAEVRAVPTPKERSTYLDLQPKANHKLKDDFHTTMFPGNNLAELPRGEQKFADVKFLVGDGLIQLGSAEVKGLPDKV